jgi:hypothetical protein
MQFLVKCLIGIAIFAAPCVYDADSSEPSPAIGLVAAASVIGGNGTDAASHVDKFSDPAELAALLDHKRGEQ